MAKQTALELKRKEVREEILALKEKIPSARILNFFGRSSKNRGWGYWLINIVLLNLVLLSPWLLIGLALKENDKTIFLWTTIMFGVEAMVVGIVLAHIVAQKILDDIANLIIEKINNADDLSKLLHWLQESWSFRYMSAFILLFGSLWVLLGMGSMSLALHEFIGFGLSLTIVLVALLSGINFYMIFWVILLTSNLKNYRYDINTFLPVDSEVVNDINEILTKRIYIVVAYFALNTLISASSLMDPQVRVLFSFPIFLIAWALIITQFLHVRLTIGKIINREKWKTLNKIQAKINSIEADGDLSDKETAERLLRLVDIHGRVMASKTNAFDLKSLSTLFSQLMLPLLGLLLGNLDNILDLLQK